MGRGDQTAGHISFVGGSELCPVPGTCASHIQPQKRRQLRIAKLDKATRSVKWHPVDITADHRQVVGKFLDFVCMTTEALGFGCNERQLPGFADLCCKMSNSDRNILIRGKPSLRFTWLA